MLTRTTVSLEQDYLDFLKFLAIKTQRNLSQIVNEAVRLYLSETKLSDENMVFFDNLASLRKDLSLNKETLLKYVKKGRI